MDIFLVLALFALGYALVKTNKSSSSSTTYDTTSTEIVKYPPGYNPYILNQFQEMKDQIFSADLRENRIETKQSTNAAGVYGITETQIKFNPSDATTIIYTPKHRLNI